ncbi:MAG: 3-hydroxyacyl-CoA dehydrogenase family protein [Myxococcota bacterium]
MSEPNSERELVSIERVKSVAVLGAGTMGHGIAQVAALAGFDVVMRDIAEDVTARGLDRIRGNLDKGIARGKVTTEARDAALARITTTSDLAGAVSAADVVIEAAPESMDLKREIFTEVDRAAPARAILATNTSSLSVTEIASCVTDPGRVVGMHFFNPVHIMKLLEVVYHPGTAAEVITCARALGERMGKTAISVKDGPGFASSRLGLVLGLEAMRMLEQGVASAADIDAAMKLGYGHPMGPLELTDLVGLDVRLSIADYLAGEIGEHFRPPEILRRKVADGHVGKKSGQGFYRWDGGKKVS